MLHLLALQHSLGAGLQHLRADCRMLSGRACTSALQRLHCSLAAGLPPRVPPRLGSAAAERRSLHICASRSQESVPVADEDIKQQNEQQHGGEAAGNDAAAAPQLQPPVQCSTTTAVGQVMAAQANFVRVKVEALEGAAVPGEAPPRTRLLCVVRALLKKIKQEVLVGDRVRLVGIDWADGRGMVDEVLPRSSQLSEPAVANVNHVLLVFSAALPGFQPSPATRYLLSAEAAWLPVTVAINKADLLAPEEVAAVVEQVTSWGYNAVPVSVVSGQGLDALTEALRGRVTVVAGPSGAGKSSIINALRLRSLGLESTLEAMAATPSGADYPDSDAEEDGEGGGEGCGQAADEEQQQRPQNGAQPPAASRDGQQQTPAGNGGAAAGAARRRRGAAPAGPLAELDLQAVGNVSQRIGRGKHTTRNVTLLELEGSGGLVVDTPGFNQPSLGNMTAAELDQHFPEIRRLTEEDRCAFRGCQHLAEPGCVVREAGWERYPLYAEIHAELKALEEVEAQRQAGKKRREGSVRMKSRAGGQQGVEARLETKTHRRVSRRSVRQKLSDLVKDMEDDDAL